MMYSTQQAVAVGLTATAAEKVWLGKLQLEFERHCYAALERQKWDLASMFATQSQLCREALDAEIIAPQLKKLFGA